jgi:hypothetical protein
VIHADGLSFANGDNVSRVLFFDANYNYLQHVNRANLIGGSSSCAGYEETENGFRVTLLEGLSQAAYAAFNFKTVNIGSQPVIAVNEEIQFAYSGFLADGIRVKAEAVEGLPSGGGIAVTGATVGQTVKISEVDENGVPTAWEPVDFPSGGGGNEWKVIEGSGTHGGDTNVTGHLYLSPTLTVDGSWTEAILEATWSATSDI